MASLKSSKQHAASGGNECPKCGSVDIESSGLEADGPIAWAEVTCQECGFVYQEEYRLVGYTPAK